jgi:hypothetical protein
MDNHPLKHQPLATENSQIPGVSRIAKASHTAKASRASKKSSKIANFLLKTKVTPLVLIGQGVQAFGFRTVGAFLLGAGLVYGYACLINPLPYSLALTNTKIVTPPDQSKIVTLHGKVRDSEGKPIKDAFNVGVLANQLGPVQNSDGSFALEVPQSNYYNVALWQGDTVKVFMGFGAEKDGEEYKLRQSLPFLQAAPIVAAQDFRPVGQMAQVQSGGR